MRHLKWLFILYSIQGLGAVLWTLFTPSESGRAVFLWLSPQRVLLLATILAFWGGVVGVTIWIWRSELHVEHLVAGLDQLCLAQARLGPLLILFFAVPLVISVAALKVLLTPLEFVAYQSWAPSTFPLLHALVAGSLPALIFVLLTMIEAGAFLTVRYWPAVVHRETWDWRQTGRPLVMLSIALITVFHWTILAFQLRFLVNIPAWYWKIEPLPFTWRDVGFGVGALFLLVLAYWTLVVQRRLVLGLIVVFLLGWFLQFGVGIMTGQGLATLGERYFSTYHKAYVLEASRNHSTILESIQDYEDLYGSHPFTSTKPPGLMAFYIGFEQVINGHPTTYTDDLRYQRLSQAIEIAFPVLAASMVFLIYLFSRRLLQGASGRAAILAPMFYVLCPSVVLFSLFADQAIYPLVFLLGAWFTVVALRRQSLVWAFLVGVLLYLAVFFAFTMLPLYPFAGLYLMLLYWRRRSGRRWTQPLRLALTIGAGTVVLYLLLLVSLHYNFLPRFEKTMAINHNFDFYLRVGQRPPAQPESFSTRLGQIINAAWVNNLDFAAAIGFPIYVLFAVQGLGLIRRVLRGNEAAGDIILMSLLLSFIVLNLAGTAQGEVPRLWLFWLPMVLFLASMEIESYARRRPFFVLGLAFTQILTIVLTFHFQDLRM
jgi:hypothetical protein